MSKYLFILFLSAAVSMSAQDRYAGKPNIRNFSKSDYQAGTQNWVISQDNRNFIYFANNDGLLSFDGVEWNLTRVSSSSPLRSVFIDSNNAIYAGLINDLGFIKSERHGSFAFQSLKNLLPSECQEFDDIWKIFGWEGSIVFQSYDYLFLYQNDTIKVLEPQHRFHFSFHVGDKMFVQEPGVGLFELTNGELARVDWWKGRESMIITDIIQTGAGEFLIGTNDHGLFLFNNGDVTKWDTRVNDYLLRNRLFCAVKLPGDLYAFGTILNGIVISDSEGNIVNTLTEKDGLGNNTVLSLFVDKSENLWVGLDNGIAYIETNSPLYYIGSRKIGTGYCSIIFENKLYLGTNQGLYVQPLDAADADEDPELVKNTAGQVWTLAEFDGQLLCGHNLGTFIVNGTTATRISDMEGVWKFIPLHGHPDLLLAGYYEGLLLFRNVNGQWKYDKKLEGFEESSRYLFQDEEGYVWIGHSGKGIFRLQLNGQMDKATNIVRYAPERGLSSRTGNILFKYEDRIYVSADDGIYVYHKDSNSFIPSVELKNIFESSGKLKCVAPAGNGYTWFIADSESGYVRKNEDLTYTMVTVPLRKLRDKYVNEFEFIYPYDRKNIFIGIEEGFVNYNPQIPKLYNKSFGASITRVDLQYLDSVIYLPSDYSAGKFEFPYIKNAFRFHFASPFFENESPLLFSYFLEGFSDEWSDWSTDSYKDFTRLRDGSYAFLLKAKNIYGEESEITSFHFEILHPWWRSLAAYLVYLLIISLVVFLLSRYLKYRLKLTERQQEEKYMNEMKAQEIKFQQQALLAEKEILDLKHDQLKSEMIFRDKELANQTMALIEKNKFLKRVNDDLQNIQEFIVNDLAKSKIKGLKKEIKKEIDIEHQNKIFETYFDEAHEEFFRRLLETFPDLTPYDLRICAFIKMNLSTKEIANILNISYRGAEVSRYRLRKKMNLSRDVNLSSFLAGF